MARFAVIETIADSEEAAMEAVEFLSGDGWTVSHADIIDPEITLYGVTLEREW
jgi:hypothetical protein